MLFKAQILALDFLISFSIFLTIFSLIILNYFKIQEDLVKKLENEMLISSLENVASFFDFTGYPENWNCTNFEAAGFLKEKFSSEIDLNKLSEINNCLDKIVEKELIYGKFVILSNNLCFGFCDESYENAEKILVSRKFKTLNGSTTEFQIIIWK